MTNHEQAPGQSMPPPEQPPLPREAAIRLNEINASFEEALPVGELTDDELSQVGVRVGSVLEEGYGKPQQLRDKNLSEQDIHSYAVADIYLQLASMRIHFGDSHTDARLKMASEDLGLNVEKVSTLITGRPDFTPKNQAATQQSIIETRIGIQEALKNTGKGRHAMGAFALRAMQGKPLNDPEMAKAGTAEAGKDEAETKEQPTAKTAETAAVKTEKHRPQSDKKLLREEIVDSVTERRYARSQDLKLEHDTWVRGGKKGSEPKDDPQPHKALRPIAWKDRKIAERAKLLKRRTELATIKKNRLERKYGAPPNSFGPLYPRQRVTVDPERDKRELITADAVLEAGNPRYIEGEMGIRKKDPKFRLQKPKEESRFGLEPSSKIVISDLGTDKQLNRLETGNYSWSEKRAEKRARRRALGAEKEYREALNEIEELRNGSKPKFIGKRIVNRAARKFEQR